MRGNVFELQRVYFEYYPKFVTQFSLKAEIGISWKDKKGKFVWSLTCVVRPKQHLLRTRSKAEAAAAVE